MANRASRPFVPQAGSATFLNALTSGPEAQRGEMPDGHVAGVERLATVAAKGAVFSGMNGAAERIELFDLSIANGEGKVCFEG